MHGEPLLQGNPLVPVTIVIRSFARPGIPLSEFLDGFPDVSREQAIAVIDLAAMGLLESLRRL